MEQQTEQEIEKEIKEVREIQKTILPVQQHGKVSEEELFSMLRIVAPGTGLRTALEGIVRAGKGAIIVIENEHLLPLLDGGFRVNCRFTPQRLVELAKMDGAIVLSKDMRRINHANILLTPDNTIRSSETGTRHKAAERTAKQIGNLVIAISERKREINIFYKGTRYTLKHTDEVLRKANEHLQLIEKQRELFDKHTEKLNKLEIRNYPSLLQAMLVIQKGKLIEKISSEIKRDIVELGNESTILRARLKEILAGVEKEINLVIKDYTRLDVRKTRMLLETLSYDEILDSENILKALAYEQPLQTSPIKGWRILTKTSLPEQEIAEIIKSTQSLGKALHSHITVYTEILGEEKAARFKEELTKIKVSP